MEYEHVTQTPHCDSRVLHAPNECIYCDAYPLWQELRQIWGIAFTGHSFKNGQHAKDEYGNTLLPCPAEFDRGMESIDSWPGNTPMTAERREAEDLEWAKFEQQAFPPCCPTAGKTNFAKHDWCCPDGIK